MYIIAGLILGLVASAAVFEPSSKIPVSEMTEEQLAITKSVASVVLSSAGGIVENSDGTWTIPLVKLKEQGVRTDICSDEKYADSLRGVHTKSGAVLIGPRHVLLAGHSMVTPIHCQRKKIVFGLNDVSVGDNQDRLIIANENVYSCEAIEWVRYDGNPLTRPENYLELDDGGLIDAAVIRLDRPVTVAPPARIQQVSTNPLREEDPVFFVSGMMGTLITGERATVKQVANGGKIFGVQSDSTVGSSGGSYFDQSGYLRAIHIASGSSSTNWATTYVDPSLGCKRWLKVSTTDADFSGRIRSPRRGGRAFPTYSVALSIDAILPYISGWVE